MTAKALLDREPHPSRDRIREALSGNLCRCTGYLQIVEAVEAAAERLHPTTVPVGAKIQDIEAIGGTGALGTEEPAS